MTADADAERRDCERAAKLPPEKQPTHGNGDAAGSRIRERVTMTFTLDETDALAIELKADQPGGLLHQFVSDIGRALKAEIAKQKGWKS